MSTSHRQEAVPPHQGPGRFDSVLYAFMFPALLCFGLASAWLAGASWLLFEYFYFSTMLALTHLVTLGFITSLMMGVVYRLAPMHFAIQPRSVGVAWLQCTSFLIGASGMIFHFWIAEYSGMAWATILVWLASVLQIWNFSGLLQWSRLRNPANAFVAAGLVYLCLAATMGILLGFQKLGNVMPFASLPLLSRLSVHVHLALVGWVVHLIFGFQARLLPSTGKSSLWLRFALLQVGLVGLMVTLLGGVGHPGWFAPVIAAAFVVQSIGPWRLFVTKGYWEWEIVPCSLVIGTAALGVALAWGYPSSLEQRALVQTAYVYTAVYGYIGLTIVMTVFKLFPMWVWKSRFSHEFGRRPVPGMKELAHRGLTWIHHLLLPSSMIGTVVALLLGSERWAGRFLLLQLIGVLAFLVNFGRVARWKFVPSLRFRPSTTDMRRFREMFPSVRD